MLHYKFKKIKESKEKMLSLLTLLTLRSLFGWAPVLASLDKLGEDIVIESDVPPVKNFRDFSNDKMSTSEELLRALNSMSGLSEDDKEAIRRDILKGASGPIVPDDDASLLTASFFTSQFLILFSLLSLIAFIFVFFGYKLYKSLSERERKREEKKKNKQMK
ncbi:PREDICTED: uncharacterized protein LOC105368068, partial [Ceratosolen solmsi marchali]|uniref:Uncharacterized protein LOC105368068 n=1 Tax=Ceratosolen solmsi marchali TaxID=326594 RepID=A0AAJ6YVM5_9HYME